MNQPDSALSAVHATQYDVPALKGSPRPPGYYNERSSLAMPTNSHSRRARSPTLGRHAQSFSFISKLGLKDSAIQAPVRLPSDAQWIYGRELAGQHPLGSLPRASVETASPSARPSSPPVEPSPSLAGRLIRWFCRKFSFISRNSLPQADVAPNPSGTRRSARGTVVSAPDPIYHLSAPTEVAIVTTSGLQTYIYDLNEFLSPVYRTDSIPSRAHSTCSSPSREPGTSSNQTTHYKHSDRDASMIIDHLRDRQFRQVYPVDTSSTQLPLDKRVAAYLERPPDNHEATQVRTLILSGHNVDESRLVINPEVTFPWARLRSALQKVPPRVVVVVMLACCHAGRVLEEFIAEQSSTEIVVIAATEPHETAEADTLKGDYLLDAVFEVLQAGESQVSDDWSDFLGSVVREMNENTSTQNLVAYVETAQVSLPCNWPRSMRLTPTTDPILHLSRVDETPAPDWTWAGIASNPTRIIASCESN
ncbi:hypothetical protein FS749_001759 [Ceratobasidium sp. UAMH 11750]|nr:hypothetical protein FS749_001759 [Ceratobasidium sp. UAMH 11750]